MNDNNQSRAKFINDALCEFRGGMAREFYFTNEDYPHISYYYDSDDDCLHSDEVSVPFHYKEEEINNSIIESSLEQLQMKVMDYYRQKGIILYEYD